jgi:MoaA/NifB/PqqE/SkfB family radical SAM enzyme
MARQVFTKSFLQQLASIRINGNYGDIVMNPEGADIVDYFRQNNSRLEISVSTNGAARNQEFWQQLALSGARVSFCLDGLEDTHHLYRQNTIWSTVIRNAKTFIDAGGQAVWKMIKFAHNQHQIEHCRTLSTQLNFDEFMLIDQGRDTAPVFNSQGKLTHTLGNYDGNTDFQVLFHKKKTDLILLEDIIPGRTPKTCITCETQTLKSIYIAANGDVSPCCYTGFYPKTYGHGQYHQAVNAQLAPMIQTNNALEHSIEDCIAWFNQIKRRWNHSTYEQGRLVVCDDNCGSN